MILPASARYLPVTCLVRHLYMLAVMMLLLLSVGCSPGEGNRGTISIREGASYTRYASGFEVERHSGYDLVQVFDPWQNSSHVTFSYLLGEDPARLPDSLRNLPFITVPVNRVITFSTTHVALIQALGESVKIRGVSGSELIYDPEINQRIRRGEVVNVGNDRALDYEKVISLRPDVMFLFGVEERIREISDQLTGMGIPVVFCGDYLERHPLGRAEWIRFFALFFQKEQDALRLFRGIDSSYRALTRLTADLEEKPAVLTGLPWKDTWYMAGGNSFTAKLIEDAGGRFLWDDTKTSQAIPMDMESVFSRAVRADVWINPGEVERMEDLVSFDGRFSKLDVVANGMVFNNNARMGPSGGNDYWESGIVRPDLVLADLISIFHPALMEDHRLIYYKKLK